MNETETYSIIILKTPDDEGGGMTMLLRRDGKYTLGECGEELIWSGLTLDEAIEKQSFLKERYFKSFANNKKEGI